MPFAVVESSLAGDGLRDSPVVVEDLEDAVSQLQGDVVRLHLVGHVEDQTQRVVGTE